MAERRRLLVSGQVQGVWFRDATRAEAERLGLSGWVRNLSDGRVEIEVEGPDEAVGALAAWAHHGPERAVVTDVDVTTRPSCGESGFTIRPTGLGQDRV